MSTTETKKALDESELANFTGSENWYRHWLGKALYTDGMKFVAEHAGAFWLIDEIVLNQTRPKVKAEEFRVWILRVDLENRSGVLVCEDGNGKFVFSKRIPCARQFVERFHRWRRLVVIAFRDPGCRQTHSRRQLSLTPVPPAAQGSQRTRHLVMGGYHLQVGMRRQVKRARLGLVVQRTLAAAAVIVRGAILGETAMVATQGFPFAIGAFQDALSKAYEAIRSGPKTRRRVSLATIDETKLRVAYAYRPYWAVRAHLLQRLGKTPEALDTFDRAIGLGEPKGWQRA